MIAASPRPEDLPATSSEVEGQVCSKAFVDQLGTSANLVGSTHRPLVELFGSPLGLYPRDSQARRPKPATIQSP
jgi:hypothetical protein